MSTSSQQAAEQAVELVARTSYGRLVAWLASVGGDVQAAEDALGDALLAALQTWPERGVPERPDAWLVTAARRRLVDAARRRGTAERGLPEVARLLAQHADAPGHAPAVPDERLGLMFACAHPVVPEAVRSPLMLQVVLGLDAARLAPAFLVPAATMGQRLVRAKAAVRRAGVPFALPERDELPARLGHVLDAVYAAYGAGWDDPAGLDPGRRGLTQEALRLAHVVVELLPGEPEAHGLLALLLHLDARSAARRDAAGEFVPLAAQDTSLWSREQVAAAERHLQLALAAGRVGPYQLQAAVQSVHALRAATGTTDWASVCRLYDGLAAVAPTVGALVARAAAHRELSGAAAALALLDELPEASVGGYQPAWVLRALSLADLGEDAAAARAAEAAVRLTADPAVRRHLARTLPGQDRAPAGVERGPARASAG